MLNARSLQLLCGWLLTGSASSVASTVFGFDLSQPVPADLLGASTAVVPAGLLLVEPATQDATQQPAWLAEGQWWYATPGQLPERLRVRGAQLRVALDEMQRPVWLRLDVDSPDCSADLEWLLAALARRYGDAQWQQIPATKYRTAAQLRTLDPLRIAMHCDASATAGTLTLEYKHQRHFARAAQAAARAATDGAEVARRKGQLVARAAQLVGRQRTQPLLRADRFQIHQLLGYDLDRNAVLPAALEARTEPMPEVLAQFGQLGAAWQQGTLSVTTDASGAVVRLVSEFADPDASRLEELAALLTATLGAADKDTARHKIFRAGQQRVIIRHGDGVLRFVYLDRRRVIAQKAQARALEKAREDAKIEGL